MPGALGTLLLVNVHDALVPREDVLAWFTELALDVDFLPTQRSAYDAFKAATSVNRRAVFTADAPWHGVGVKIELRWETGKDPHTRTLVRRKIRGSEVLGTERIADAVFVKGPKPRYVLRPDRSRIPPESLSGPLDQFFRQVEYAFRTGLEYLDQDDMRSVVREYLLVRLHALRIGSRGNYFVHRDLADELGRLAELLTRLGPGSHLLRLDLVDDEANRAVVAEALRARLSEDIDRLARRVSQTAKQTISALRYAELHSDYQALAALASDYVGALQLPLSTPELAKLEALTDQIVHLGTQRRDPWD